MPGNQPKLFERSAAARIARVGIPSMLQQSMVSLSMMMMQGLVNSYGKVFVAGYTAATNLYSGDASEYEFFQCDVQLYGSEYRCR